MCLFYSCLSLTGLTFNTFQAKIKENATGLVVLCVINCVYFVIKYRL